MSGLPNSRRPKIAPIARETIYPEVKCTTTDRQYHFWSSLIVLTHGWSNKREEHRHPTGTQLVTRSRTQCADWSISKLYVLARALRLTLTFSPICPTTRRRTSSSAAHTA